MSARPVVCLAHRHLTFLRSALEVDYTVLDAWSADARPDLHMAQALVVAGEVPLDLDALPSMPRLGLVASASTGYDGIDVGAARRRGLQLSHARHVNDGDVADHALGCIIVHHRDLIGGGEIVRSGDWPPPGVRPNRSLSGMRIGILGLGDIGRALAERAVACRMEVAWWGPRPKDGAPPRAADLVELASGSDVLVVTARSETSNRGIVDREVIEALGPRGLLVNVARGQLVDEDALVSALRDGRLGAAALDVFQEEPTPPRRWLDVPNVTLTPHTAGRTAEGLERIVEQLRGNLAAFFSGRPLLTPIP